MSEPKKMENLMSSIKEIFKTANEREHAIGREKKVSKFNMELLEEPEDSKIYHLLHGAKQNYCIGQYDSVVFLCNRIIMNFALGRKYPGPYSNFIDCFINSNTNADLICEKREIVDIISSITDLKEHDIKEEKAFECLSFTFAFLYKSKI